MDTNRLETAIEILRSDQPLPPQDKERAAIAANINSFLSELAAEARKWAPGVLSHVDFEGEPRCSDSEMMVHIITPQGGVTAGKVAWRMIPERGK